MTQSTPINEADRAEAEFFSKQTKRLIRLYIPSNGRRERKGMLKKRSVEFLILFLLLSLSPDKDEIEGQNWRDKEKTGTRIDKKVHIVVDYDFEKGTLLERWVAAAKEKGENISRSDKVSSNKATPPPPQEPFLGAGLSLSLVSARCVITPEKPPAAPVARAEPARNELFGRRVGFSRT